MHSSRLHGWLATISISFEYHIKQWRRGYWDPAVTDRGIIEGCNDIITLCGVLRRWIVCKMYVRQTVSERERRRGLAGELRRGAAQ